jgi:hypothetical protein
VPPTARPGSGDTVATTIEGGALQFTRTDAEGIAVHAGFWLGSGVGGSPQVTAGALVTLPDRPDGLADAEVVFTLLSASGEVLDRASELISYIPPRRTVPVAPLQIGYGLAEDPVSIEVAVTGTWAAPETWTGTELEVVNAALGEGRYGFEVTGEMVNHGDATTSEKIVWHCVFLESDDIVGGATSQIVLPVPPGGAQAFNAELSVVVEADELRCRAAT